MQTKKLFYPIVLVLVIAGMYGRAVLFPFIGYDSHDFIVGNALLGSWNLEHFLQIWKIGGIEIENLYIPLTYTTFFIETAFCGITPFVLHFDNILLHTANTILLFFLIRQIGCRRLPAFIASLAFALHPLQVEPVVWCMGRKDLLSTFFALIAIISYLLNKKKEDSRWIIVTISAGICAMFSKPVMIVLPVLLLITEYFLISTAETGRSISSLKGFITSCFTKWSLSGSEKSIYNFTMRKVSILLLTLFSVFTVIANLSGPFRHLTSKTPIENLLCLIYMCSGWIKRFFMSESIEHFYRWPAAPLSVNLLFADILLIIFILFILIYIVKKGNSRPIIFALIFTAVASLPSIAHLRYTQAFITADRYGYFPLTGIFIAIALLYDHLAKPGRRFFSYMLAVWFILIFINNISAVNSWSNDIRFWTLETDTKPESTVDNYFLGLAYQTKRMYPQALEAYDNALNADPDHQKSHIAKGGVYFEMQQYDNALKEYRKALSGYPEYIPMIYANMGETYLKKHDVNNALDCMKKSLKYDNSSGEIHLRIAQIYLFIDKKTKALRHLKKASDLGIQLKGVCHAVFESSENEKLKQQKKIDSQP